MDELTSQFDQLYTAYADAIFRHLYYRLGSRDQALDLTQEVFAGLWKRLCGGQEVREPRAYLYRSAHNAFVNELRRAKRALSLDELQEVGFDPKDEAADATERAAQREIVEKLQRVEEPYRTALVLRHIDGFRVQEIAELLNEKENTITVRLKRGTEKLKTIYGPN